MPPRATRAARPVVVMIGVRVVVVVVVFAWCWSVAKRNACSRGLRTDLSFVAISGFATTELPKFRFGEELARALEGSGQYKVVARTAAASLSVCWGAAIW